MKFSLLSGLVLSWYGLSGLQVQTDTPEMTEARVMGVAVVQLMQDRLMPSDEKSFPGIHEWMAKEGKSFNEMNKDKSDESWRKLNSHQLVLNNANFWQMYYEVVPGDPGLAMLHAGVLLAAGDADRAQTVLRMTLLRSDLDETTRKLILSIMQHCGAFMAASNKRVSQGITLHDKGDFDGALKQYDAAARLWPLNGWAAYERGTTLRSQGKEGAAAVAQAFAQSREMQPFQFHAWQGTLKDIPGMKEMLGQMPELWEPARQNINHVTSQEDLLKMCEILQLAEVDDLALVARQIYIIRRGSYAPEDHSFIAKSLRRLVPGPQAEATITHLSGEGVMLMQIYEAPGAAK